MVCKPKKWKATERTGQPEYAIWSNIKQRCYNPKNKAYRNYGGRGITLCAEWQTFDGFLAGVGKRPSPDLELDRIRNREGYKPGNVRWTTRKVQAQNKRNVRWIEINGERLALPDFAKRMGISYSTAYRWYRSGELTMRLGKPTWTVLHPSERIKRARSTKTSRADHFKVAGVTFHDPDAHSPESKEVAA